MRFHIMMRGLFIAVAALAVPSTSALNPVILVNGLAGAQIKAELHSASPPHSFCPKDGFHTLWVEPQFILPYYLDCLYHYLHLSYDEDTKVYSDSPGVSIDVVDFGKVDGLAYLEPDIKIKSIGYFEELIAYMQSTLGYTAGVNLVGAPFDWRLASDGLTQRGYYSKVQSLVESIVSANGNEPAVFVTHSMGGPVILEFFNQMSQEWKQKYISKFIALSPPFGGAMSSVRAGISGDNFGIPFASESVFLPIQRGAASGPWLFPQADLWPVDDVLVFTPSKNYTTGNFNEVYIDLNDTQTLSIYNEVKSKTLLEFRAPNVDTYVLHGSGVATDGKLVYAADFVPGVIPPRPKEIISEDGDGTVSERSLVRAKEWTTEHGNNGFAMEYTELKGTSHYGILQDKNAWLRVVELLSSRPIASKEVMLRDM